MAIVLKKFPWAKDGFTVEILEPGAEREFGAASVGLEEEGYISANAIEAPDDAEPTADAGTDGVEEPVTEPVADTAEVPVTSELAVETAEDKPAVDAPAEARRPRKAR